MDEYSNTETDSQIQRTEQWLPEGRGWGWGGGEGKMRKGDQLYGDE